MTPPTLRRVVIINMKIDLVDSFNLKSVVPTRFRCDGNGLPVTNF